MYTIAGVWQTLTRYPATGTYVHCVHSVLFVLVYTIAGVWQTLTRYPATGIHAHCTVYTLYTVYTIAGVWQTLIGYPATGTCVGLVALSVMSATDTLGHQDVQYMACLT